MVGHLLTLVFPSDCNYIVLLSRAIPAVSEIQGKRNVSTSPGPNAWCYLRGGYKEGTVDIKEEMAHNLVTPMMALKGMLKLSSLNRKEHFRDVEQHGASREKNR